MGEAGGQRPLVQAAAAGLLGEFLAVFQGDGDAQIRFDEQVALGQEAGEQHAVPVLVGAFLHQAANGLLAGGGVAAVAKLPGMGAEAAAQLALGAVQMVVGVPVANCQSLQGGASGFLCNVARVGYGAF